MRGIYLDFLRQSWTVCGDEFRIIITTNLVRHALENEQIAELILDILAGELVIHSYR